MLPRQLIISHIKVYMKEVCIINRRFTLRRITDEKQNKKSPLLTLQGLEDTIF